MSGQGSTTSRRDALRGVEARTFDLIFEVLTPEQWAELLRAPLERARTQGIGVLVERLVNAGAEVGVHCTMLFEAGKEREIVNDLPESGGSLVAKDANDQSLAHFTSEWGGTDGSAVIAQSGRQKRVR